MYGWGMPAPAFVLRLNEQIANEFAASQQYIAVATYYDDETLPRLAAFFYAQAIEERKPVFAPPPPPAPADRIKKPLSML